MKTVIKMVSSGLYIGYLPFFQGTFGSVLGLLIYLQLKDFSAPCLLAVFLLYVVGFLICTKAEDIFGKKDSPRIVIDEVASMCLVYLFVRPTTFMLITGFLLFRVFDIIKPPPAKRLQAFHGSAGVMLDDMVAAVYTIISLAVISHIGRILYKGKFF